MLLFDKGCSESIESHGGRHTVERKYVKYYSLEQVDTGWHCLLHALSILSFVNTTSDYIVKFSYFILKSSLLSWSTGLVVTEYAESKIDGAQVPEVIRI